MKSMLKMTRIQRRLTAAELGDFLGLSEEQIARYETDISNIPAHLLVKMANFFDVNVDYLLGRAANLHPYKQKRPVLSWRLNASYLLKIKDPAFIGRLLKIIGITVLADPERFNVSDLLKEHPPEKVEGFLNTLNPQFFVVRDDLPKPEPE